MTYNLSNIACSLLKIGVCKIPKNYIEDSGINWMLTEEGWSGSACY
jgi:hypothetical protein